MFWRHGFGRAIRLGAWLGFLLCFAANRYFYHTYGRPCVPSGEISVMACGPAHIGRIANMVTILGMVLLVLAIVASGFAHTASKRKRED